MPYWRKCLNLGCGLDKRKSTRDVQWINVDVRREVNPDLVWDMEKTPYPFMENTFDLIIMRDSLEHVSFRKIDDVIKECHRILKPNGKLFIQCPDLEAIAHKVILNPARNGDYKAISYWVYGSQDYPENSHKSGFTIKSLKNLLESHGFKVDSIRNDGGTNIIAEATKVA